MVLKFGFYCGIRKNILLGLFNLILILSSGFLTYGQNIDSNNIENIDVDSLSDDQIRVYWEQAQKEGYTLDELGIIAAGRGMSQVEIAKLKRRVSSLPPKTHLDRGKMNSPPIDSNKEENPLFGRTGELTDRTEEKSEIFGYDFFNNPNISFEPNVNLATPANYQLGPGDELTINIWGAAENTYNQEVGSDGAIRIENVGPIYVSGLSVEEAKSKINSNLRRIYSGISASANSPYKVFTDVTITNIRRVQVNIIGEVEVPGTYSLSALSTVLNALYAAGGPNENGTFRNIKIVRGGEQIAVFDIYKYLVEGSNAGNEFLEDQDVIIVSPYEERVEVEGAAKRPGIYEVRSEESFEDLKEFFGSFSSDAYKERVVIERVTGTQRSIKDIIVNGEPIPLKDGDIITIGQIVDRYENKISIAGAVYRPGSYELEDNTTLSALFDKALGVRDEALMGRAILYRVIDGYKRTAQSFSVEEVLDKSYDLPLRREDSIYVFDKNNLREKLTLTINGAVNKPMTIDYVDSLKVEDLIAIAGGFKEGADVSVIDISRRVNDGSFETLSQNFRWSSTEDLKLDKRSNFNLKPFDQVSVRYLKGYSTLEEVKVEGEVSYPGNYTLSDKNYRVSDLLSKAGGLSPYANIEGATLVRKRFSDDNEEQQELLLDLGNHDSITDVQKKIDDFRIGLNLNKILEPGGKHSKYDLILEEGDILTIPSEKQTVEVRGEVLAPSLIRYDKSMSLKQYINGSGGFTSEAKKNKTYVIYANGEVKSTKNFLFFKNYPRLEPGSVILVPPKPERTGGLSVQEIIGITTGLGTIGLIIDRLSN